MQAVSIYQRAKAQLNKLHSLPKLSISMATMLLVNFAFAKICCYFKVNIFTEASQHN